MCECVWMYDLFSLSYLSLSLAPVPRLPRFFFVLIVSSFNTGGGLDDPGGGEWSEYGAVQKEITPKFNHNNNNNKKRKEKKKTIDESNQSINQSINQ